jgi:cytochrome c551/c552
MKCPGIITFGCKYLAVSLLVGIFSYSSSTKKEEKMSTMLAATHFTKSFLAQANLARDTGISEVRALLNSSDCYTCHAEYKVLTAPSFSEIAARYKSDTGALQKLINKVLTGSIGTWGDRPMPAHPELLREDVQKMIQYILSLKHPAKTSSEQ